MKSIDEITALSKRRGFIFPGSEIYGGLANTYDYGPYGVELLRNIRNLWWDNFVTKRADIYGLESSIIMSPRVWDASGHTESFTDPLIECKNCNSRTRADHLIEDNVKGALVEGVSLDKLYLMIQKHKIKCPVCQKNSWTKPKKFNLLFNTHIGILEENKSLAYLRGETAQGMFVDFKHIIDSMHPTIPFGIAQSGKAFRNEVTMGKLTFRTLEFDLAEFEYFIKKNEWKKWFKYWKSEIEKWIDLVGIDKKNIRWRTHTQDELSHYSLMTEDLEYKYPFGYKELHALAYRANYDLANHMQKSGVDLRFIDSVTGEKFIPHVIEPTFGLTRLLITLLIDAYTKKDDRTWLALKPVLAPVKMAVFPLLRNKPDLIKKAKKIFDKLSREYACVFDTRGNIGKRYYAQDEIGTPYCITIDFQSLKDNTITIRDRDTTSQQRIDISKIIKFAEKNKLK